MSVMGVEKSKSSSSIVFSPKGPGRWSQPPKHHAQINPIMMNVFIDLIIKLLIVWENLVKDIRIPLLETYLDDLPSK